MSLILRGHLNEGHARPRKQALQQLAQRFVANAATRDLTQDGLQGDKRTPRPAAPEQPSQPTQAHAWHPPAQPRASVPRHACLN